MSNNNNNRNNNKPQPINIPTKDEVKQSNEKENEKQSSVISQPTRPRSVIDDTPEQAQAKAKPQAVKGDNKTAVAMRDYLERMEASRDVTERGEAQAFLLNHLVYVVKGKSATEFRTAWNYILDFFDKNKDKMNELTLFQGVEAWPLSSNSYDAYRALINLILVTRDPATRFKNIKTLIATPQLINALSAISPEARKNITGFYRI